MGLLIVARVAGRALWQNKVRSALTMLGIVIGVAAVIATVAIGEGASAQIGRSIASVGVNMIWVEAGNRTVAGVRSGFGGGRSLTVADYEAIRRQVTLVTAVTPQVDTGVQVVFGNKNWRSTVRGVSPDYLTMKNWLVVLGGMFTAEDVQNSANVCVIGRSVAGMLFDERDPVGETIRVKDQLCRVIGVLDVKGQSTTGQDQDDTLLMPWTTVQKKIKGQYWLDDIMCSALSAAFIDAAEREITILLRERHRIPSDAPDDFTLRHPTELAEAAAQTARTLEVLLATIASVSLLVGGIGVMNIMLVSVTERTREIGIRLSIGARGRDVRRQFLTEAVILSLAGGAVGLAAGVASAVGIANTLEWPTRVPPSAIAIAVGFSAAIGIFFGYYPAAKAARLDPIDALRFE